VLQAHVKTIDFKSQVLSSSGFVTVGYLSLLFAPWSEGGCLSPAKLRSTDSVYPRVVLSRVLSPAIGIYSKSQTVLARYQWTDNKSYKDQSYKGPGLNSKFEKEKKGGGRRSNDSVVAPNRLE